MRNAAVDAAGPQVEKFAAPPMRWMGLLIMGVAAAVGVALVVSDPIEERGFGFLCTAVVLLAWVVLVRPLVSVHENGVLITNMLRDAFLPSSKIHRCRSTQTLQVLAAGRLFHGLGVSRSARSMMRQSRAARAPMFGGQASSEYLTQHRFANEEQTGGTYAAYVESRVEQLGSDAKPDELESVVVWAWQPVTALIVALCCLGLLLVR